MEQRAQLGAIGATIDSHRIDAGKQPASNNTYIVINTDEPYAPEVVEILKRYGHWGEWNEGYNDLAALGDIDRDQS